MEPWFAALERTTTGGSLRAAARKQRLGLAHLPSRCGVRTSKPLRLDSLPNPSSPKPQPQPHQTHTTTDAVTRLPSRRVVGDTLKQMLAEAARTTSPFSAAVQLAERIRQSLNRLRHDGIERPITTSFGIATYPLRRARPQNARTDRRPRPLTQPKATAATASRPLPHPHPSRKGSPLPFPRRTIHPSFRRISRAPNTAEPGSSRRSAAIPNPRPTGVPAQLS